MSESHWVWFFERGIDSNGRKDGKATAIASILQAQGYPEGGSHLLRVVEQKDRRKMILDDHGAMILSLIAYF